jgi:hypothetical protein
MLRFRSNKKFTKICVKCLFLNITTVAEHFWCLVNKANFVHNFSWYVYFYSLRVSGNYVPIIRTKNCIFATLGTCYSVWLTVWYAGWNETEKNCAPKNYISATLGTCYSVWMTVWYAGWNETEKNCAPSWLYLQDYTAVHGQQNINFLVYLFIR